MYMPGVCADETSDVSGNHFSNDIIWGATSYFWLVSAKNSPTHVYKLHMRPRATPSMDDGDGEAEWGGAHGS